MAPFRSLRRATAALLLVVILAACANNGQSPQGTGTPNVASTQPAATSPGTASPTAASTATETASTTATPARVPTRTKPVPTPTEPAEPGVTYRNPIMKTNFPDPFILPVDGMFYAYATNGDGRNVQTAVSEDLVTWEGLLDAMPALPPWADRNVWAPEVIQIGNQYVLYFTAHDVNSDRQCIGRAVSDQPQGKFKDTSTQPFICQVEEGGSIDASPFRDGDRLYLYWKNDGNCCGRKTYIYAQEMTPDGNDLIGEPVRLVESNRPWEGAVVEAPTMINHEGSYYLFFSGNAYDRVEYAVGYATCESPLGPCEDAPENPILKSYLKKPPVIGPGHQDILRLGGQDWIFYHAWEVSVSGVKTDRRFVYLDRLDWENGKPVIRGPTVELQPVPEIVEPVTP